MVTNKSWIAIGITSVRNAIIMLCTDRAEVIDPVTYETFTLEKWCSEGESATTIRSAYLKIPVPQIVKLNSFNKVPTMKLPYNRENLYKRDKNTCQYCGERPGRKNLSIDHVVPRAKGGRSNWENCVLSCLKCNNKKGNCTPKEAGMTLIRNPKAPNWKLPVPIDFDEIKDCWRKFIVGEN